MRGVCRRSPDGLTLEIDVLMGFARGPALRRIDGNLDVIVAVLGVDRTLQDRRLWRVHFAFPKGKAVVTGTRTLTMVVGSEAAGQTVYLGYRLMRAELDANRREETLWPRVLEQRR